jgi:hypothetical protein
VDHSPLQQFVLRHHGVERGVVDEAVVDALHLTGTGRAGGDRHRDPDLGWWARM